MSENWNPSNYDFRLVPAHGIDSEWSSLSFYYTGVDGLEHRWGIYEPISTSIPLGVWKHVAVTFTYGVPETIRIYINGVSKSGRWTWTGKGTALPTTPSDNVTIGAGFGGGKNFYFPGTIDEISIYNRALSVEEIKAHYEEVEVVKATIDIDPDTLNLASKGRWITAYVELPSEYDARNINIFTVRLNAIISAETQPTEIGDYDKGGIADLMVKFDRSAVEKVVPVGDKVTITISGQLSDGKKFEGTDTIRVISPSTLVDNESDIESTKPENFPEPSAVQFYQMAPGQRVNALGQNYPNPFNPATTIEYSIAQDCQVTLKLYNVAGQLVATLIDEWQTAGPHKVVFDAGDKLSRGIYYYQLKAGNFVGTKKMVVLK